MEGIPAQTRLVGRGRQFVLDIVACMKVASSMLCLAALPILGMEWRICDLPAWSVFFYRFLRRGYLWCRVGWFCSISLIRLRSRQEKEPREWVIFRARKVAIY